MNKSLRRILAAAPFLFVLASCASSSAIGTESMMRPTASPAAAGSDPSLIHLSGTFIKLTGFPCHRSDPYVGNETVVFIGADGSRTTIVTDSADWLGLAATRQAPLGQCRQVAPYAVDLPLANRYVVLINDRRLAPVTLATLRAEGLRHTFRLGS